MWKVGACETIMSVHSCSIEIQYTPSHFGWFPWEQGFLLSNLSCQILWHSHINNHSQAVVKSGTARNPGLSNTSTEPSVQLWIIREEERMWLALIAISAQLLLLFHTSLAHPPKSKGPSAAWQLCSLPLLFHPSLLVLGAHIRKPHVSFPVTCRKFHQPSNTLEKVSCSLHPVV